MGHVDVLGVRGRALGLVHGDLNLERTPRHPNLQVMVEVDHMGDCPAGQNGDRDEVRYNGPGARDKHPVHIYLFSPFISR